MTYRSFVPGLAALALVASPVAAQAADADISRSSAPVEAPNALASQNSIVFYLGIAAVALAIVFLSEDGDDDSLSV